MSDHENPIAGLSDALADAVESAAQSVVTVSARRRFPASGIAWTPDLVVTADHVVEREDNITITTPGGEEIAATIAGRDPGSDIAILRIATASLTPLTHGPAARVGHLVLAVGRPGGETMASFGVVGALGGPWRTATGGQVDGYVRADATLYPGFSGGPLIDTAGRVIGLNSSQLGRGAGLAIPVAAVEAIVQVLLSGGRVKQPYIGIASQPVRLPSVISGRLDGQETGLLVSGVESGAPADVAGLFVGDIVVAAAGQATLDTSDLQAILTPATVDTALVLSVVRAGEPTTITITVGERPEPSSEESGQHGGRRGGPGGFGGRGR